MKRLYFLLTIISTLLLSPMIVLGQTGPAGVGTGDGTSGPRNVLWLRSDIGITEADGTVSAWADQSGNGFDATQGDLSLQADYTASNGNLNGLPSINFGSSGGYLTIGDNDLLDDTDGLTAIFVLRTPNSIGTEGVLSKRIGNNNEQAYVFFTTGGGFEARIDGDLNVRSVNSSISGDESLLISAVFDGSGQSISNFINTVNEDTQTGASNALNNTASDLFIGNFNTGDGRNFEGDIAEIILYRDALNVAERLIIENYLAEKYNIPIATDLFSLRNAAYVNNIRGIGTANGIDKYSESGFSDALKIDEANNSLNATDEYVLFAHDNTAHAENITDDISDPEITDRWARSWFIENSGTVSANLIFDFGDAGFTIGSATDYVLLYRPDLSSDFSRVSVNSYSVQNTDQLVIDAGNTNLNTGYYTLGRGDQLIPGNVYSFQSGDWNDPLTWTTDPSGALRTPSGGILPTDEDNVTILSGDVVTMDSDDNDGLNLTVNEKLIIGNTSGHDFTNIAGGGTISIAGDASNNDNFPSGSTGLFADSIVGGTVEISGSAINLNQDRTYNNLVINLDNSSDVAVLTSDYTLFGDLTLQNGELSINDNTATNNLEITTYGDVLVEGGASITTGSANARHEFNFYGDLSVSGSLAFTNRVAPNYGTEANDGIVDANFINDSKNQTIDCNGVSDFYRIEIDKGNDQTYILDINASSTANFNLYGPADYTHGSTAQLTSNDNALGLLRGTVRLNNNVNVPVLNNGGNYNISEAARLWVNGGSATKPSGTAIVPYGTIQLSAGTIDAPINSGITTRANGNIVVSGGEMTVNQIRTSVNGPENIGGYTQSGGTVNVTGDNISTSYYAFSLTYPGNTFNMSGGTLHVSGARTGSNTGGIFIASSKGNQSVTGGDVIMDISRNDNFKLTSNAPFWNVFMRKSGGSGTEIDLISGASGTGGNVTNITNPDLTVLNDLIIENGVTFDHNGNDVAIGSDFTIEDGAAYVFDNGKPNTTSFNGTDNAVLSFLNRTGGGTADEQDFWNLIIDRPSGKTVTLVSGKTGSDLDGSNNNLVNIKGDAFKLLSGTLDQSVHSIRVNADTLLNYDVLTVFDDAGSGDDSNPNSDNDLLKLRPTDFVLMTADTSIFGNLRLNNSNRIVTMQSDLAINRLEYRHGRMNLGTHNLTIDKLDVNLAGVQTRTDEDGGGNFSVEDMFITAGNASDGGLSLKVNADGTNPGFINMTGAANTPGNPTVFFFPLGTGTTGDDATSEYTPANIRLLSATDEGYMTVIPVTKKLATAGPYPLGNDVSDRYWIVDYRDFTTVPKVERMWFRSVEKDDPTGGNPNAFPPNYVPGYVLEDDPFTRTAEDEAGAPGSSGIDNTDAQNIRIFFWGNEGAGNPAGGFDLINAAYTAGDASKFVGAPTSYFSVRNSGFGGRNWDNNTSWYDSPTGTTNPPDFPDAGDIVYIRGNNGQDAINVSGTQEAAKVIFQREGTYNDIEDLPRLRFSPTDELTVGGDVSGVGDLYLQQNTTTGATLNADIGLFAENDTSLVMFYLTQDGTYNVVSTDFFEKLPTLRVYGNNGNYNRIVNFNYDLDLKNLIIDGESVVKMAGNIAVEDRTRLGYTGGGRLEYPNGAIAYTLSTGEFVTGRGKNQQDNNFRVTVDAGGGNGLEHIFEVRRNLELDFSGRIGNEGSTTFDLFSNFNDNNVILKLTGDGDHAFIDGHSAGNSNIELYKIRLQKESSNNTFSFGDGFDIPDATATYQPLDIIRGKLIINTPDINSGTGMVLANGTNFLLPNTGNPAAASGSGGLELLDGTFRIEGDDTGLLLDGHLLIDGGTLDMDDAVGNGNNFIEYSASGNAVLEISSGSLNVGSQIRPITSANTGVLKYRQTGGDVRIGTQAGPTSNRGMLQIYNVGSEFTYTGGTLAIERHQSAPTIAALFLDPDVRNVSATIDVFNANTPAGQNDFGINSTIPLAGLNINGTNNPTAFIAVNPLEIDGNLFIESGASLNGNGNTLTLNGDFENDGSFDAQGNEVIFSSETSQELLGSGTNNFFRFTKTGIGSLNLNNSIEINDLFTISDGNLNDSGNDITLRADAVIDGEHRSSGGNGLVFDGPANQELRKSTSGTGTLGIITINNSNGVTIPDGNGYNFDINGGLRLDGGVFEVGGSNILFGQSADIVAVQPFSVSNMIKTNSSFADKGVGKTFAAGTTTDFTFPLGQAFYTPVVLDLSTGGNTSGSTTGTIFVSPANEFHPTVDDGTDNLGSDVDNVLQYYWTLTADGINNFSSNVTLGYNDGLVATDEAGFDESDYIAVRILAFDNPTNEINKFATVDVDQASNLISFDFTGESSNGISGDYFAGIDQAIPDNVVTYVVQNSTTGDIRFSSTYTTSLPTDGIPPSGAVVEIPAGSTLQLPDDNIRLYKTIINDGGTLEVINSTNHRLGILEGTGNLKITSDGINANLPAFSGNFLSCSGGGLEYAGTGSYSVLSESNEVRNLIMSGTGDRNFPNGDIQICEDFVIDGPNVTIQNNRRITIDNDLIMESGTLTSPTGSNGRINIRFGNFIMNGGTYNGSSAGRINVVEDLIINGGTINAGSANFIFSVGANMTLNAGTFNSGTSLLLLRNYGPYASSIKSTTISGDFTGSNAFNDVEVQKNEGNVDVIINSDIEIVGDLTLNDGLLISGNNEVRLGATTTVSPTTAGRTAGKSNSYITGKVTKPLSAGQSFTFPTGSTDLWRPATVKNVSTGGLTWEAQFFAGNVVTGTIAANLDPSDIDIETIQGGEYWVISDGDAAPSGVTAEVGLSWGIETDVSSNSSDLGQLRVMVWNDGNGNWDNLGGSNINGSQSQGTLESSSTVGFSENIFVMGSTDAANPLPVELTFFTAENKQNRVELEWQTASEKNNDFFEVQRSFDGKDFEVLGIVEGNGDSQSTIDYNFNDYSPLSGDSYYRLRQVDYDGAFEYSEVVKVNREQDSDLVAVPNPASSQNIHLRLAGFHAEQKVQVTIFDIQGRRHYQAIHDPADFNEALPINQNLNSGIYIIDVKQGNINKKVRLMVR